jgi:RNA-directed DNA polymerase
LRLKVNAAKSAVARPEERHFLGLQTAARAARRQSEVLLVEALAIASRRQDPRADPTSLGRSLSACIAAVNVYLRGWIGFFGICTQGIERTLGHLDAHIRRRLRAIQLRHWKSKR